MGRVARRRRTIQIACTTRRELTGRPRVGRLHRRSETGRSGTKEQRIKIGGPDAVAALRTVQVLSVATQRIERHDVLAVVLGELVLLFGQSLFTERTQFLALFVLLDELVRLFCRLLVDFRLLERLLVVGAVRDGEGVVFAALQSFQSWVYYVLHQSVVIALSYN